MHVADIFTHKSLQIPELIKYFYSKFFRSLLESIAQILGVTVAEVRERMAA
jgi:hypothetical protein